MLREKHRTDTAGLIDILTAVERRKNTAQLLFLNLSEIFNAIHHALLQVSVIAANCKGRSTRVIPGASSVFFLNT